MFSKKLISILLTLALLVSASGCGSRAITDTPADPDLDIKKPAVGEPAEETPAREYSVRINELMAKNRVTVQDEDGDYSDWIELYNYGTESVSLSGLYLSDESNSMGWALPDRELGAGEYITVFASGKDRTEGTLHTDFSLSAGETVRLRNSSGEELSALRCLSQNADEAVLYDENGAKTGTYPTPGSENSIEAYILRQEESSPAGPLVINEACTFSTDYFYMNGSLSNNDWVEIKNISSASVQLSDYFLSDDRDEPYLLRLPNEELYPGGVKAIMLGGRSFSLDSESASLYLTHKDGETVDAMPLLYIPANYSFGRMEGENGFFYFNKPTPGYNNTQGYRYISEKPVCLTQDGVYNGVDSVTVELSGKGRIFYTTDGTLPNENSREYTGAFTVESTTAVRAVSIEPGALPSRAVSCNFIINENHTLPVVALNFDNSGQFGLIWYDEMKTDEIPCNLSFYEDGGSFSIDAGMKLNGETSLVLPKKNMGLRFRGCYGDATLKYDLYGGGATEFQNLILRAGQDYYNTVFRNELCQELCNEFCDNVISQRSRFAVLYINGEYFGVYTLKEKTNEALYAYMTGTSVGSAEALEANIWENTDLYKTVLGYVEANDMSKAENYEELCRHLDVDSLIDWLIAEGMCANNDLTSGNLRYVRSADTDNRWKLMFYDLDATFAYPELIFCNVLGADRSYQQVTALSRKLMKNADFRDRFLKRTAKAIETVYTNENILAEIDRLTAEIEPEMERDFNLRGLTMHRWYQNISLLKTLITEENWADRAVRNLRDILKLTPAEVEYYFG